MMCDQLCLSYISMLSDVYSGEFSLKLLELLSRFGEYNKISNADKTELLLWGATTLQKSFPALSSWEYSTILDIAVQ